MVPDILYVVEIAVNRMESTEPKVDGIVPERYFIPAGETSTWSHNKNRVASVCCNWNGCKGSVRYLELERTEIDGA